jgi:hypothetical protein
LFQTGDVVYGEGKLRDLGMLYQNIYSFYFIL